MSNIFSAQRQHVRRCSPRQARRGHGSHVERRRERRMADGAGIEAARFPVLLRRPQSRCGSALRKSLRPKQGATKVATDESRISRPFVLLPRRVRARPAPSWGRSRCSDPFLPGNAA